jgi:hypothetical protein
LLLRTCSTLDRLRRWVKESLTVVDELHDRGIGHDLLQRPRPHHVSVSDDTPIAHERGEHTIPAAH